MIRRSRIVSAEYRYNCGFPEVFALRGSKLLKISLFLIAGMVLLLLILTGIGATLPETHQASRTLHLSQSPEAVWEVITNRPEEPSWRNDVTSMERLPDRNGNQVWREVYRSGDSVVLETIESQPPGRLVRRIADDEGPFSGTWTYTVRGTDGGSTVNIEENGRVPNPFFRFVSKYVIGHELFLDTYLKALARKFGDEPRIT